MLYAATAVVTGGAKCGRRIRNEAKTPELHK
jgi:hypothetical protein